MSDDKLTNKYNRCRKVLDLIHTKIHALRMMPNYKPTLFEQEMNCIVADRYSKTCSECEKKAEYLKYHPAEIKKGVIERIFK